MWKDSTRSKLPAIKAAGRAVPWTWLVPGVSGVLVLILGVRIWLYGATWVEYLVLLLALLAGGGFGFVGVMKRRPVR